MGWEQGQAELVPTVILGRSRARKGLHPQRSLVGQILWPILERRKEVYDSFYTMMVKTMTPEGSLGGLA